MTKKRKNNRDVYTIRLGKRYSDLYENYIDMPMKNFVKMAIDNYIKEKYPSELVELRTRIHLEINEMVKYKDMYESKQLLIKKLQNKEDVLESRIYQEEKELIFTYLTERYTEDVHNCSVDNVESFFKTEEIFIKDLFKQHKIMEAHRQMILVEFYNHVSYKELDKNDFLYDVIDELLNSSPL